MNAAGLRVVILSYGMGGQYRDVVAALLEDGLDAKRIVVVHNPSTPGEQPPAETSGCEVIVASHNLGYAAGMNLGIGRQLERECELLLLLTHDAGLRPGALERLLTAAHAHADFGVLGPVLMLGETETVYSFGGIRRNNGSVAHRTQPPGQDQEIAPCDWVDGGTMLVRADALRRVGVFDERFWGYTEEADLCLRIDRTGLRIGVVIAARADQDPGGPKRPGPWAYLLTRNGLAYARRSAGARGVAFIAGRAILVALYELARALARGASLRPGSPREPWAVAVGTIRGMSDFARGRWGAPPPGLPGAGDVKNAESPS